AKADGRAPTGAARRRTGPAVRSGDRLDDGETEPHPVVAGAKASRPGEPIEDPIEVLLRDTRARVGDREDGGLALTSHGQIDRVLVARVLHRVLDERVEREGQAIAVCVPRDVRRRATPAPLDVAP